MYTNSVELQKARKNQNAQDDFIRAMSNIGSNSGSSSNQNQSSFANNFNNSYNQAGGQGNGLNNLGKMFGEKLAGMSFGSGGNGFNIIGDSDLSSLGSGGTNSFNIIGSGDLAGSSNGFNVLSNSDLSSLGSSASSGSGGFWSNLGSKFSGGGSGGGTPWGLIGSIAKKGYNTISGHDDKDYSDTEESIIYPLQGAATGAQFGPWGAAIGGLYGLGYSFKDDIGLKDSNFLTQMLFPIDMGDGGGLRIGGKSVIKL